MEISVTGPNSLQHSHCCSSIMWLHGGMLRCVGLGLESETRSFYILLSWSLYQQQQQEDVNIQDMQLDGSARLQDLTARVKKTALETAH